ncbi:MAG: precorrin-8X methylmutase [Hydrococcus sp. RU_2_2]|jgi:precorrin-8X/cobalt-precorrin-8 methylmutase|nr:precorrin-8X methylmutase [Hydrococcus sp. RU_2_2]NJP19439.1 precorrin-8X methylmutase [Hydrococcus sp. CRU_1_1]
MEWHITDAQSLAIIDREIGESQLAPAEYEIARRVIYTTADFEYQFLLKFSDKALQAGAAALAARSTIIVDVPMVQVGILPHLQKTFVNPIYCSSETITRPQKEKTQTAWGMQTLARRYPEAIFIIGQSQTALTSLVDLIEQEEIKPALVVGVPAGFIGADEAKKRLQNASVPNISIDGRKGSSVVAVAIFHGLIDLAWQAYGQNASGTG